MLASSCCGQTGEGEVGCARPGVQAAASLQFSAAAAPLSVRLRTMLEHWSVWQVSSDGLKCECEDSAYIYKGSISYYQPGVIAPFNCQPCPSGKVRGPRLAPPRLFFSCGQMVGTTHSVDVCGRALLKPHRADTPCPRLRQIPSQDRLFCVTPATKNCNTREYCVRVLRASAACECCVRLAAAARRFDRSAHPQTSSDFDSGLRSTRR